MDIILHHYDESSFSEKVRLMLGLKGLAWHSVEIPSYGPKPEYTPLTAGYRRTPALQLGADVYCDTRLIAEELERRVPEPSLFPAREDVRARALSEVLVSWAEQQLFRPLALAVTGEHAARFPAAFHADRAALHGKPSPDVAQVMAAARHYRPQFEAQLRWLEDLLADGQAFVLGARPCVADFAIYAAPWFLETVGGRSELLDALPLTRAWMARVAAIGHGHRRAMRAADAWSAAAACAPLPCMASSACMATGIALGEMVRVAAFDQQAQAQGRLAALDDERISLRNHVDGIGEIATHFPRLGYRLRAVHA
ncbi:MAG: glutathione S-transferase family protein [Proteobacteria bacterium]|nr:glutathione S-transferase family protein [Pseudomonadota bacterium]